MEVRALTRDETAARLDQIAALRITVFREWPYLYQGDDDYERHYLRPYIDSAVALVAGAFDGPDLVGVSTSTPMEDHAAEFGDAFAARPEGLTSILYGGESLLLPRYRGRGVGHSFFDLREAHARALGRAHVAFCSVVRPDAHPSRPPDHRGNEAFWVRRGYAPLRGVVADFVWRDIGEDRDAAHPMQFWMRTLPRDSRS